MMRRRGSAIRGPVVLLSLLVLWTGLGAEFPHAAAEKVYAHLRIQGMITDPAGGEPMAGAVVTLTADGEAFKATTNRRGVFAFEKVPLASYRLSVESADGRTIRTISPMDQGGVGLSRFDVRFGRGEGRSLVVEGREAGVTLEAPAPSVRWGRFWKQFAIFAGAAALLAL